MLNPHNKFIGIGIGTGISNDCQTIDIQPIKHCHEYTHIHLRECAESLMKHSVKFTLQNDGGIKDVEYDKNVFKQTNKMNRKKRTTEKKNYHLHLLTQQH